MPFGMDVGLSPGDLVLDGDPVPLPKKGGGAPKFSAHVYCGQRAGRIKMPLGTKVGLSPGDSVLDGNPAPYPKGGEAPPNFRSTTIVAKRLYGSRCHLVYGGRPRPTQHCVRCGPSYPQKKGTPTRTQFRPMSIVAKWLDG